MTLIFDLLYLLAAVIVGPFYLLYRLLKKKPTAPLGARLWRFPQPKSRLPVVWIHGVSVGEILAARGLVDRTQSEWADHEVVISCTTPTGFAVARREYPGHRVFFCPLDFSFSVRRALKKIKPKLFILMELELWPNLLMELKRRQIPLVLANGRISAGSARGYRRLQTIHPGLLEPISKFLMQDDLHAARLADLGVPAARIEVFGNLKVDNLEVDSAASRYLAIELGLGTSKVFVAGSTHEGEDEAVFRAYLAARRDLRDLRLVLAPRHLERLESIESLASSLGLKTVRRKEPQVADESSSVVLVDTLGELPLLFGLADVVFLGGSLVDVGGHNVLEPAICRVVQILGPHTQSVQGFVDELRAVGAAIIVDDDVSFARELSEILDDAPRREAAGLAAEAVVVRHCGALDRTMNVLSCFLDSRSGSD